MDYDAATCEPYTYAVTYPDSDAAAVPARPGLQTDLHLPRAPEPAQPGLHDERLDADADVDGRRERATSDRAAVKEKP
jgi:hypothetical protein